MLLFYVSPILNLLDFDSRERWYVFLRWITFTNMYIVSSSFFSFRARLFLIRLSRTRCIRVYEREQNKQMPVLQQIFNTMRRDIISMSL